jgi:H+/Cl- antiporter ClcA
MHTQGEMAGSAGAASGIAGGYRLPFTAVAVVLGQGGIPLAMLCCLATVVVATAAGAGAASLWDRCLGLGQSYIAKRASPASRERYATVAAPATKTSRREERP